MLTVNLEKELIKQNKKLIVPEDLLYLKEYERLGEDFCDNEVLNRVGITESARRGRSVKLHKDKVEKILEKYNQERVFHISQIESLCKKYHLRFLNTNYFKGSVDKELGSRISNFEIAYEIKIKSEYQCKIAAPASSFKLEKKPKTPYFSMK